VVHRTVRSLDRRLLIAAFAAITLTFVSSHPARADQATFGVGSPEQWDVPAGTSISYSYNLYVCGSGAPNVAFENVETFAPGETVTAALTPMVWPAGSGTIELTGATSVVGIVPATWSPVECFTFSPEVSFRYTAPSAADLDCDDHPAELTFVYPGAHVEFAGDAGTRAQTVANLPDGLPHGATIPVGVRCPAAEPAPTPAPTDPLAGGSVGFALGSYRPQGDAYLPLANTEFHIAVTNGSPSTAAASTAADGLVSFDVTVATGHASASIEVTEVARTDYPLQGASCGHDFLPLLDWTDRPSFTLEVDPGWNVECTFYHVHAGASLNPAPDPTPPPTDTDAIVAADDVSVLPLVLLLLAISAVTLLGRRETRR
jgi:hypothetical protein